MPSLLDQANYQKLLVSTSFHLQTVQGRGPRGGTTSSKGDHKRKQAKMMDTEGLTQSGSWLNLKGPWPGPRWRRRGLYET